VPEPFRPFHQAAQDEGGSGHAGDQGGATSPLSEAGAAFGRPQRWSERSATLDEGSVAARSQQMRRIACRRPAGLATAGKGPAVLRRVSE
jgi:hypothetical protein